MLNNLNTADLEKTKRQLKDMMKGLNPLMDRLTGGLEPQIKKLMEQEIETEKKVTIKRKPATIKLCKNGNIILEFKDAENGKWFYNNIK